MPAFTRFKTLYRLCKHSVLLWFKAAEISPFSRSSDGPAVILVAAGEYHETLNVTRRGPLTLLGELPGTQKLNPGSPFYSNPPFPNNLVQVWDNKFVQTGMDDAQSAVLNVAPSFNASLIGAGPTGAPLQPLFGNTDFKAYNIDFQNRAVSSLENLVPLPPNHTHRKSKLVTDSDLS